MSPQFRVTLTKEEKLQREKDFQPNTLENCPQEKLIWRN
jgi:hypothetical protein